jgi:hypothetical protein
LLLSMLSEFVLSSFIAVRFNLRPFLAPAQKPAIKQTSPVSM